MSINDKKSVFLEAKRVARRAERIVAIVRGAIVRGTSDFAEEQIAAQKLRAAAHKFARTDPASDAGELSEAALYAAAVAFVEQFQKGIDP